TDGLLLSLSWLSQRAKSALQGFCRGQPRDKASCWDMPCGPAGAFPQVALSRHCALQKSCVPQRFSAADSLELRTSVSPIRKGAKSWLELPGSHSLHIQMSRGRCHGPESTNRLRDLFLPFLGFSLSLSKVISAVVQLCYLESECWENS
uniref:Uncharacterized protein n=1 Tax=Anas platyrhynchos platyrhynchos TaxID=8840 RepID=A0A493U190_ANAPP